jgi:methyl-accepting chemotaxis protein
MALGVKGKIVLTSSGFSPAADTALPDYESVKAGGDGYWVGKSETGEKIMAVCADISSFSTEYSAVRVVTSLSEVDQTITSITVAASVVCAAILLLLIVTGIYFVGSIIRPIQQISTAAGKYAKGDFAESISYSGHDEIGDLCENRIAAEIMGKYSNIILMTRRDGVWRVIDSVKRVTDDISSVRRDSQNSPIPCSEI